MKEAARAEVRALEAKANQGSAPAPPGKVVEWWDGPRPEGRVRGTLKQVDCLGRQARLVITSDDQKALKLIITDPGKIVIMGGGDLALGCGPQKNRPLTVEYVPKANPKTGTAGEVVTIEFR